MTITPAGAQKSALSQIIAGFTHQKVLAFASLIVLLIGFSLVF